MTDAQEPVPGLAALHRYGRALATLHGAPRPDPDDEIVTHRAVVNLLPRSIRNDFLPPAQQDYAYVCGYHPSGGFLVEHRALKRLDEYA